MEFDRTLVFAEARPGKERQTQIDGGRIERIDRMRQFQAEAVLGVEFACRLDQAEGEVLMRREPFAKSDKGSQHMQAHLDCSIRSKHVAEHQCSMLGKGIR